jgi:hypothetical protein
MSTINSLLTESSEYQKVQSQAMRLAGKWKKSGLLEGLSTKEASNMAVLLENEAKQIIAENNVTAGGITNGATFTPGVGEQWAGIALPLVRKVFGQIAAKEFVSVQPMNLPAGLVFFLDFQYGTDKKPFTAGQSLYGTPSENFGNLAEGGLYGAGRFGYSTNQFSGSASATAASASWADLNYDANYSASAAAGTIKSLTIATSSIPSFDVNAVRSFIISGAAANETNVLQAFTKLVGDNIVFFTTAAAATGTHTVFYSKQTDFNVRGDFEDRSAAEGFSVPNAQSATQIVIPEVKIQMRSEAIVAKTKKLKAEWTQELVQDLDKFQNVDAEAELTSMIGEYVALEIDLEILDMLIQRAPADQVSYWSAKSNTFLEGGAWVEKAAGAGGYYNSQGEWFQTLGTKLQALSNKIHQRTMRGGANFMVVSPAVATIIESIPGFAADGTGDDMKFAFGVQKVGQLNSRYKVYKNPYLLENLILLGFRGSQFLETGAVYAPYVPLMMTPLVYDPETFTPRKGLMTRYAKKIVRPEFYAKLYVAHLNVV